MNNEGVDNVIEDTIELFNTSKYAAKNAIFIQHLGFEIDEKDFNLENCSHDIDYKVYPKGIIQFSFNDIELETKDKIILKYKINTRNNQISENNIICNNYLFFVLR